MSYISGTAIDQFEMLAAIKNFLEAQGWTTDSYTTDTSTLNQSCVESSANAKRLHIHKNGIYLNFRSTDGASISPITLYYNCYGIGASIGTGYNSSNTWLNQTGVPTTLDGTQLIIWHWQKSTSLSYRMFYWDSPFTFFIYCKHSTTKFSQLYFGEVSPKYGSWNGGKLMLSSQSAHASDLSSSTFPSYAMSFLQFGNPNVAAGVGDIFTNTTGVYKGALNLTTSGIVASGNTWPTCGAFYNANTTQVADTLIVPYMGQGTSIHNNSLTPAVWEYPLDGYLLYNVPGSFTTPIFMFPIQPAILRDRTSFYMSLLGELPYMKMCSGPSTFSEQIVTYGGNTYILLPLGTLTTNPLVSDAVFNKFIAVKYEG